MTSESKNSEHKNILFFLLAALRFFLVIIPQRGYIHPDEYFQSVEVLAGRILDVDHSRPWEFDTTQPIRGITIPYFTIGFSYIFLRDINKFAIEYLSINVLSPYFLLVVPRLIIALFSLVVDYSLVKICLNNNEKYSAKLLVLGTSYVMVVYATRTFSNSIELILFALLLYFVCESSTVSNELLRKQVYIKYRYEKSTSTAERAKFHKMNLFLTSDNYRNCFAIATITVFGVFNRPTFIAYAILPVFFWINRGINVKHVSLLQFHTRIIFLFLCSVPAIIFNVLIDSFYYGSLTWAEIGMMEISINNFVMTPYNFIKYNTNSSNLEKHGLHSKFMHLLINIPLLFNVLGILALCAIGKYIFWSFCGKFQLLPSIRSIKMLMTLSFISPLIMLSVFPHQEPRFLIPLILPLIYLHGDNILPDFGKTPGVISIIEETPKNVKRKAGSSWLFKLWLIINTLLIGFYGFVHQGGIYSAVSYLHDDMQQSPNSEFHIVTSNMYTIPQSFFLQRTSDVFSPNRSIRKRVHLYEEGSEDIDFIVNRLKSLMEAQKRNNKSKYYKIYFLTSNNRKEETEFVIRQNGIILKKSASFGPHLSTEAAPDLTKYCFIPESIFYQKWHIASMLDYFARIFEMYKLIVYQLDVSQ